MWQACGGTCSLGNRVFMEHRDATFLVGLNSRRYLILSINLTQKPIVRASSREFTETKPLTARLPSNRILYIEKSNSQP